MEAAPADAVAEANRLYWETELPVSEIAARLDLSRRALYETIQPVHAEGKCEQCGEPLVYAKRSSRAHGLATCSHCGERAGGTREREAEGEPWTWSPPSRGAAAVAPPIVMPASVWLLGAAALAGALLSAGVTLVLVRRP